MCIYRFGPILDYGTTVSTEANRAQIRVQISQCDVNGVPGPLQFFDDQWDGSARPGAKVNDVMVPRFGQNTSQLGRPYFRKWSNAISRGKVRSHRDPETGGEPRLISELEEMETPHGSDCHERLGEICDQVVSVFEADGHAQ